MLSLFGSTCLTVLITSCTSEQSDKLTPIVKHNQVFFIFFHLSRPLNPPPCLDFVHLIILVLKHRFWKDFDSLICFLPHLRILQMAEDIGHGINRLE